MITLHEIFDEYARQLYEEGIAWRYTEEAQARVQQENDASMATLIKVSAAPHRCPNLSLKPLDLL